MKKKIIAPLRLDIDPRIINVDRDVACNVSTPATDPELVDLPTFPDSVFENLPAFLQKVVARCDSNEERDMMLLGSLTTLGAGLPKVYGYYGGKRVYPYLYLFITAQASAGKGKLELCRQLVNPIHDSLRELTKESKEEYKTGMRQYNMMRWEEAAMPKPDRPAERMLFIPANNSASGFFELLAENEGRGLLFETEGDTLSNSFKAGCSDFSDGMRKAAQHEMISIYRKTKHEHFEIKKPCLAGVFSGTPRQVLTLIPSAEDGLLSRYIFYHMNTRPEWKDPLAKGNRDLEDHFDALGKEFFPLYKALSEYPDIEFSFTDEQHDLFNAFFVQIQEKYLGLQGLEYIATIRRLGLIAFRLAMILTSLRIMETGNFNPKMQCSDIDFQRVLSMIRVLIRHSSHVFSQLPSGNKSTKAGSNKELFLNKLPLRFTRSDFIDVAKRISINERTAERYMVVFCTNGLVAREQRGTYTNLTLEKGGGEDKRREQRE
ncbi:MAG TPA: DNA primase [Prolixibacteraceae bacterium]|jgi:hypothetical protein|nr:DNA primase [Prolixibacteraceae bacterium]